MTPKTFQISNLKEIGSNLGQDNANGVSVQDGGHDVIVYANESKNKSTYQHSIGHDF